MTDSNIQIKRYFIFTFLFSWSMWLPGALVTLGVIDESGFLSGISGSLNIIGGIGPSFVAFLLTFLSDGKSGLKKLFTRIFKLNGREIYLYIIFYLPFILIAGHLLNIAFFNGTFPQTGLLKEPWFIPLVFSVFFIMQFSEEFGWRGYALDRLQEKYNPVIASLTVGVLWALWHVPMFLSSGFPHYQNGLPYHQLFITLVSLSFIITYFQNRCGGSLLPAFIIHTFINMANEVLPLFNKATGDYTVWMIVNGLLVIGMIIVVFRYKMESIPIEKQVAQES